MTYKRELFNFSFFVFLLIGGVVAISSRANVRADEQGDSGSQSETLSVTSYEIDNVNSRQGSMEGGSIITIKGYGFDKRSPSNNIVYFGDYPCSAIEATRDEITCQTSPYKTYTTYSQYLFLKVIVGSSSYSSTGNGYRYAASSTPQIQKIFPSTIYGTQKLKIWGIHQISTIGDGRTGQNFKIKIGDTLCGRSGYPQQYLSYYQYRFLGCTLDYQMTAGKYNISYWISKGNAHFEKEIYRTNLDKNQSYQVVILPLINKISPSSGTGQMLNINGTGFTTNSSRVKVNVDGRTCVITSVDTNRIKCQLNQYRDGPTSRISTNTNGTQKLGFIGGAGWNYTRYQGVYFYGNAKDLRSYQISSPPTITKIKPQIEFSLNLQNTQCFDIYKGYFKAKRGGEYVFRGAGDTKFALYISSIYGSAEIPTSSSPAIWSNQATGYPIQYATYTKDKLISDTFLMQQGKYYYMELYYYKQYNSQRNNYLKIEAQVPNTNPLIPGQVYSIQKFVLSFTPETEIIQFTQQGATGGYITLSLTRQDENFTTIYQRAQNFTFNESIGGFISKLQAFSGYSEYQLQGERLVYDISDTDITALVASGDFSSAYRYVWRIQVLSKRLPMHTQETFQVSFNVQGTQYFNQEIIRPFSPLISGTFTIQIGGLTLTYLDPVLNQTTPNIPYNATAENISSILKRLPGFQNISVIRQGTPEYGANWTIFFNGYVPQPPPITLHCNDLEGGQDGTSPIINIIHLQNYTSRILSDLDHNFLFTASESPKVLVTIDNQLLSVCGQPSSCGYAYQQQFPKVNSIGFTAGNPLVNLSISTSAGYNLNLSTLKIVEKNSGTVCTRNLTQVLPNISCTLEVNSDLSPKLFAGPIQFSVFAEGIGYLQIESSYQILSSPLTLSGSSPAQGSRNGGENITINGQGFNTANIDLINVTICGKRARVLQVSNIKVIVQAPPCSTLGQTQIMFKSGTISNNQRTYQYILPQPSEPTLSLVSLSPQSVNPALKQPIIVHGSGFGTNKSLLFVTISRIGDEKIYQLKVLKITNDTEIKVGFPGGLAGKYKFVIKKLGLIPRFFTPTAVDIDILTVGVFVNSISPINGSPYGGTLMTIVGQNFSPDILENMINIGQKSNILCDIKTLTTTQITCRTPPPHRDYGTELQKVYSTTKITEDATCTNITNGCKFSYDSIATYSGPKLINVTKTVYNLSSQNVQIFTNDQSTWPNPRQIVVRNIITKSEQIVTSTSGILTKLTFVLPNIESGMYEIYIQTNYGFSNSVIIEVMLDISLNNYQMTEKGGLLIVSGIGFPQLANSSLFNYRFVSNRASQINYQILPETTSKQFYLMIQTPTYSMIGLSIQFYIEGPLNRINFMISFVAQPTTDYPILYSTTPGPVTFQLTNQTQISRVRIVSITAPQISFDISTFVPNAGKINFTQTLMAGGYILMVGLRNNNGLNGWQQFVNSIHLIRSSLNSISNLIYGKNGALVPLTNQGATIGNNTILKVNNQVAKYYKTIANTPYFYLPPFVQVSAASINTSSNSNQNQNEQGRNIISLLNQNNYQFQYISDTDTAASSFGFSAFDNNRQDRYYSSNAICYAGIKITTPQIALNLKAIQLQFQQANLQKFKYLVIEGSNDGTHWDIIVNLYYKTLMSTFNLKRQDFNQAITTGFAYTYFRAKDISGLSNCQVDYIAFKGALVNTNPTISYGPFDLQVIDGYQNQNISNVISYSDSATPTINTVLPKTGNYFGGYDIVLTGTNLQGANVNVNIDSVPCIIVVNNETTIICTVQERPEGISQSYFQVLVNNSFAVLNAQFMYVLRWSDQATWGMSFKPNDGDLVYVPKGQVLWVDQSSPKLLGIVVEGKIIFSDEVPITITTDFITINRGQFVAGTPEKPYQNMLNFKLTGSYYSVQQPTYGTKVIACQACKFNMHAQGKSPFRWASLTNTILPNTYPNITLNLIITNQSNSLLGSKIVATSTSSNHSQVQVFTVNSVSNTSNKLTVSQKAKYKHLANMTVENTKISGEIGILESNIKIEGVDNYEGQNFGAKIMMRGQPNIDGSYIKLSNIQITKCGQPNIYNQHCITILNTGSSDQSYIKNSSIHNTYSRGISFNYEVKNFQVFDNFFINTTGHSIAFTNFYASNNYIKNNLILQTRTSLLITQKDITPAGIFMRGPMNILEGNHLAGGQFFGIWYNLIDQIMESKSKCIWGLKFNPKTNKNYIHSYNYTGLLIDKLATCNVTCGSSANPTPAYPVVYEQSILKQFYIYRNKLGLMLEYSNFVTISSSFFIENRQHIHTYQTTLDRGQKVGKIVNVTFYGVLQPGQTIVLGQQQLFIQLPCSPVYNISNITFGYIQSNSSNVISYQNKLLRSCQPLDGSYSQTDELFINNIRYKYVRNALGLQYQFESLIIVYDVDGTFTKNQSSNTRLLYEQTAISRTIVPRFSYLSDPACMIPPSIQLPANLIHVWDSFICSGSVKVRTANIYRTNQYGWESLGVRLSRLTNFTQTISTDPNKWTSFGYRGYTSQLPFIMNRYYAMTLQDFNYLNFTYTGIYKPGDGGIIIKHNYYISRELYQVNNYIGSTMITPAINSQISSANMNLSTCTIGDYYHDNNQNLFGLCLSDKNTTTGLSTVVNAIYCKFLCPDNGGGGSGGDSGGSSGGSVVPPCNGNTPQNSIRLWSNASMWPGERLPAEGQDVTIPYEWKVILNVNPPAMGNFLIKGMLIIPSELQQITIKAKSIWVKGTLRVGNSSVPYSKLLNIIIDGDVDTMVTVIDGNQVGNKMIVVTGLLSLYGIAPGTVWTRLNQTLLPGATIMKVQNYTGWKIGDQLVLGPSFNNVEQNQYVTITAINENLITFTPAVNFTHYGSDTINTENNQTIDMRATVGHLTRNIKIKNSGSQIWGFRLLNYGYQQCNLPKYGVLKLSGVEVVGGGQQYIDTTRPKPAIHIKRVTQTQNANKIQIIASSIRNCKSRCLMIQSSKGIKVNNSVIASAKNMHIEIGAGVSDVLITSNLMIGVNNQDSLIKKVACFQWKQQVYKTTTTNSQVINNVCQGSTGAGFSRYYDACSKANITLYANNSVGSAAIGYLLFGQSTCITVEKLVAYSCQIGVLGNPKTSQLIYNKIFVVDSLVGIGLRMAGKAVDQTATIKNSFISGPYRTTCTTCYGNDKNRCTGMIGVHMLVSTQQLPPAWVLSEKLIEYNSALVNSFSQASYDAKSYIINSTFSNYKKTYTEANLQSACADNYIVSAPSSAIQLIGSQHFYNTSCTNCMNQSVVLFTNSTTQDQEVGLLKPCGQFLCTGRQNYYVEDHTGDLFGTSNKGVYIPNYHQMSVYLGGLQSQGCAWVGQANGYKCGSQKVFYVMQFESLDPNTDSRILWPVYASPINLTYYTTTYYNYNGMYTNTTNNTASNSSNANNNSTNNNSSNNTSNSTTNGTVSPYTIPPPTPYWLQKLNAYKQWRYDPITLLPKYTRINRFISLLMSNSSYNISFSSTPPKNLRLQFQSRQFKNSYPVPLSQNDTNWIIVKIYYPLPNSIQVKVNNIDIQPITVQENNMEGSLQNYTNICGANKYYYKHRTIDVVINNKQCRPVLTISNSIQLTARFNMDVNQFYAIDGKNLFIDKMAALLGIQDRSRIKVVGVYRGSAAVQSYIQDSNTVTEEEAANQTANYGSSASQLAQVNDRMTRLYAQGQVQSTLRSAGFGELIQFDSTIILFDQPEKEEQNTNTATLSKQAAMSLIFVACIAVGVVFLLILIGIIIYIKKRKKSASVMPAQSQQRIQQKEEKRIARKQWLANNSNISIVDLD